MNVQIPLSPEFEAKLRERAAAAGQDVESFVVRAIEEELLSEPDTLAILPPDEWLVAFDDWVKSQTSRNANVDDSRESIYPDRL